MRKHKRLFIFAALAGLGFLIFLSQYWRSRDLINEWIYQMQHADEAVMDLAAQQKVLQKFEQVSFSSLPDTYKTEM